MIDAFGAPQSVLVLGGTSDIAAATVARLATGGRLRRVVLAGRDERALEATAERTRAMGVSQVATLMLDARDGVQVANAIDAAFDAGDIDVVLLAFGFLPDQQRAMDDPAVAVETAQVNYVGPLAAALAAARRLRGQGHGVLVLLSSVAAQRPRRSNFVYGSAKAGIDAAARGIVDELHGSGAAVLVVRPGFVRSKMTAGLRPAPLATTPDAVAAVIAANLTGPSRVVWVPAPLRAVMWLISSLPRPVLRRLPL